MRRRCIYLCHCKRKSLQYVRTKGHLHPATLLDIPISYVTKIRFGWFLHFILVAKKKSFVKTSDNELLYGEMKVKLHKYAILNSVLWLVDFDIVYE